MAPLYFPNSSQQVVVREFGSLQLRTSGCRGIYSVRPKEEHVRDFGQGKTCIPFGAEAYIAFFTSLDELFTSILPPEFRLVNDFAVSPFPKQSVGNKGVEPCSRRV